MGDEFACGGGHDELTIWCGVRRGVVRLQKDLIEQIDFGHVECLNENPDRPWSYALKQG